MLCLATFREDSEAAALARTLAVRGSATVLTLSRLDAMAIADMTRACLTAVGLPAPDLPALNLPATVHAFVADRTEGIPFLVEEVLAGLVGEGALTYLLGRDRVHVYDGSSAEWGRMAETPVEQP